MTTRKLDPTLRIPSCLAHAMDRAEFAQRLHASAYRCRKEGRSWIATGAGQRFDYSLCEGDDVLCISHTGGIYLLVVSDDGEMTCDCPASRRGAPTDCEHIHGFNAVRAAHRSEREAAEAALRAEAEAMAAEPWMEYRDYYPGEEEPIGDVDAEYCSPLRRAA